MKLVYLTDWFSDSPMAINCAGACQRQRKLSRWWSTTCCQWTSSNWFPVPGPTKLWDTHSNTSARFCIIRIPRTSCRSQWRIVCRHFFFSGI